VAIFHELKACRLCGGDKLLPILDLGTQAIAGRFPEAGHPDPPSAPIVVVKCQDTSCGLVQLGHTVDGSELFVDYHYRSSVSETMRSHLAKLVSDVGVMSASDTGSVLDIGCNDGYTLSCFGNNRELVGIDPSSVAIKYPGISRITGFFPAAMLWTRKFDTILSISCFYDAPDPVAWATAVRKILAPNGLWVIEIADLSAILRNVSFDYFVHEHSLAMSSYQINRIAKESGLKVVRVEDNDCNGGSLRFYLTHQANEAYDSEPGWKAAVGAFWSHGRFLAEDMAVFERFAADSMKAIKGLATLVREARNGGKRVHVLGASTKMGVILQAAGITAADVEAASDRDILKVGRVMPAAWRITPILVLAPRTWTRYLHHQLDDVS
jgi:NDP-4-keto-2,6-dideoxyhexose 3-C-methyltransferase